MLFRAVVQKSDPGIFYAEARLCVGRRKHGELAEHRGLALGVCAAVAKKGVAAVYVGYGGAESGALYAAYSAKNELAARNCRTRRTRRNESRNVVFRFERAEGLYH